MLHLHQPHRVRVVRFLEQQSATIATPTTEERFDQLARQIIDVMAVRGCHVWDNEIAWQSVRETFLDAPNNELQDIIDRVQFQLLAQ